MSLERALAVAANGWPVFPVWLTEAGTKRPRLRGWQTEATTVGALIREWWDRWPDALPAVPTGARSGLYVVDIDSREAYQVAEAFVEPRVAEGAARVFEVRSHREDGWHWLFAGVEGGGACRTVAGRLHPKLDVKGEGGYVVAWTTLPPAEQLSALPAGIAEATRHRPAGRPENAMPSAPVSLAAACFGVRSAGEGQRNQTLNRWAWVTAAQVACGKLDEREWREELVAASTATGYPEEEAHIVLDCVLRSRWPAWARENP